MHYRLKSRAAERWFHSVGGRVSEAHADLVWAVGRKVSDVLAWARTCAYRAYVSERPGAPESKLEEPDADAQQA